MESITVQNQSGQVVSLGLPADDPKSQARKEIVEARVRRGELAEAKKGAKSENVTVVVTDADTGVKDEKGDYLKSIHGGGIDPDADGDALGQPSGSGASGKAAKSEAAEEYVERLETVETKVETKSKK